MLEWKKVSDAQCFRRALVWPRRTRDLRDGVGQCAPRTGLHHPSDPASAAGASARWCWGSGIF